jgi:hypothetical protein
MTGNDGYESGGDVDGHDDSDGGDVIPPDPKGYKFVDPEDFELDDADKDLRESFRPVAHRLGLKQSQVDGLHDWQISNAKLIRDAERATYERAATTARATLTKEWGQDFKDRLEAARGAVKEEGLGTFANAYLKDGRRVGDTLEFIRLAAKAANARANRSSSMIADASRNSASAEAAKEQIAAVKEEALAKGWDPTHKSWPHAKLDKLYKQAFPGGPLETSGTDGNTGQRRR